MNNLPTDGSAVYVTLWSYVDGSWTYTEYQYTAYGAGLMGVMQTPTPGSTLTGSSPAVHVAGWFAVVGLLDRRRQHAGREPVLPVGQHRQRHRLRQSPDCRPMAARCTSPCGRW